MEEREKLTMNPSNLARKTDLNRTFMTWSLKQKGTKRFNQQVSNWREHSLERLWRKLSQSSEKFFEEQRSQDYLQ